MRVGGWERKPPLKTRLSPSIPPIKESEERINYPLYSTLLKGFLKAEPLKAEHTLKVL